MKLIYGVLSSALLLAISSSCSDDYNPGGGTTGKINPQLDLDVNAITSRSTPAGRDASPVTVNDLKLRLTAADGSFSKEWSSIAEFDNNELFKVGSYTLEALYGDPEEEGFEKPYYYASTTLTVRENKVTPVTLSASLANSMVSIATTEAFSTYFTNYSFQAHAEGGDYVNYTKSETRPGYLRSGKVTVTADVTKPNGVSATLEAAVFVAEPKHHYTVTVDVNNGQAGDAQLVITFDDMLNQEDVYIDLSDDILSAPAPVILPQDFDNSVATTIIEGMGTDITPAFFINAEGGISAVTLSTQSASLIEQGWPASIDLAAATPAQQSKLKSLGLSVQGLFGNIDRMAVIDFTGVIPFIKYVEGGNNENTFTLVTKDKHSKVSEPVSFTVKVEPIIVSLSEDVTPEIGATAMSVNLYFNGNDVENNVKIQYKNERGTWTNANITKVTPAGDNNYIVEISGIPGADRSVTLRAVAGSKTSSEVEVKKGGFTMTTTANNVFATRALFTMNYGNDELEAAAPSAVFEYSEDGSNFSTAAHSFNADGSVWLTGLPSGKALTIRATIDTTKAKAEITTEAATQLPNSGMETWYRQDGQTKYWWIDYPGASKEDAVWGTMNELTTSAGGSGTNAFSHNGTSYCAYSGTQNSTDKYAGTYSAYIATVGWGNNNASGSTGSSACKNLTVGELYLGHYDSNSQSASYDGLSFASRPASLSFYYKYTVKNSADYGYAYIEVFDASGNSIAKGETNLNAAGDFTNVTLPLSYSANAPKAALVKVIFKSSNNPDCQSISNDNLSSPRFGNLSDGRFTGSELWIDEISLNY